MGDRTGIEWTDATWNPLVGCEWASPGCDNCYAARDAAGRLSGNPIYQGLAIRRPGAAPRFTGEIRTIPERLDQPARWRRPRRVFVNSVSDLFHPKVPTEFQVRVWAMMGATPRHTFQVLTKRPKVLRARLSDPAFQSAVRDEMRRLVTVAGSVPLDDVFAGSVFRASWPFPNVWVGTSIESGTYAWRADALRETPAAIRWISAEPLIGSLSGLDLTGIDWLVAGGESGSQARPCHPGWVREIRDRCVDAAVPFLMKQWGEWAGAYAGVGIGPHPHSTVLSDGRLLPPGTRLGMDHLMHPVWVGRVGKAKAGRSLDGEIWDQYPEPAS